MRLGESLVETVRSLDQIYDLTSFNKVLKYSLTDRELHLLDAARSSEALSPAQLSHILNIKGTSASLQRAVDRLLDKINVVILSYSATGSPAPRVANAHGLWRRITVADILMRTGARLTARKHWLAVLRHASLPEQATLELYAHQSLMQTASYIPDRAAVLRHSADYVRTLREAETLQWLAHLICLSRTVVQRRRERSAYADPVIEECRSILKSLRTKKRTNRVTIEAARLAVIVAQYDVNAKLGAYWLDEQRDAFRRLNIWNSSMRRENYTLELTLAGMVGNNTRALTYGKLLLSETKEGSAPWFTLIDLTVRALLTAGDTKSSLPLLRIALAHPQYRRLNPSIRNRLELSLGYVAALENDSQLSQTYRRRRTSRLQRGQQSFHDQVIDTLLNLSATDLESTLTRTIALGAQIKRVPSTERPLGALALVSNLHILIKSTSKKQSYIKIESSLGAPNTIVPWDILWTFIRNRL